MAGLSGILAALEAKPLVTWDAVAPAFIALWPYLLIPFALLGARILFRIAWRGFMRRLRQRRQRR